MGIVPWQPDATKLRLRFLWWHNVVPRDSVLPVPLSLQGTGRRETLATRLVVARVFQPRSQGLSSLLPLVVGTETLVEAGHVTIYPSKTAGWVGTQVHLVKKTIKYPTLPTDFSTTQILGGHVTSRHQGLCSNDQGRQRRETLGTRLQFSFYYLIFR